MSRAGRDVRVRGTPSGDAPLADVTGAVAYRAHQARLRACSAPGRTSVLIGGPAQEETPWANTRRGDGKVDGTALTEGTDVVVAAPSHGDLEARWVAFVLSDGERGELRERRWDRLPPEAQEFFRGRGRDTQQEG